MRNRYTTINSPSIYVIFLSYYENYFDGSLGYLKRIIHRTGFDHELIVVNNNIQNDLPEAIVGDNRNWEFSGWDKGLSHINNLKYEDIVIFCNDTAAFHKPSGIMDEISFANSFRKLIKSPNQGICGVVNNSLNEDYSIFDVQASTWVSTHLFAITGGLVNELNKKISLSEEDLSRMVVDVQDGQIIWGEGVSDSLKVRIQNWLYPLKGVRGWRKQKEATKDVKLRKIKTILNEKYIAAYCVTNRGIMINAIPNILVRSFRRIISFPQRIKYKLLLCMEKL